MRLIIYACIAAMTLFAELQLRNKVKSTRILFASMVSCLMFYLITNFAVWAGGKLYPPGWEGLMASYYAALPYLKNSLAGTLVYSAALFGIYEWSVKRVAMFRQQ